MLRTLILNKLIEHRRKENDFSKSQIRWKTFAIKFEGKEMILNDFVTHHRFEDLNDYELLDAYERVTKRSAIQM